MELDVAAPETLTRVKALDTELSETRQALRAAHEKLEQAAEQLAEDDGHFAEAVDQFSQDVQEQRRRLDQQAAETVAALGGLTEKVRNAHQQIEEQLGAAQEGVAAVEQHLHEMEPDAAEDFQQVITAATAAEAALADVQEQVKEAVTQAGAAAAKAARDLRGMEEIVQNRVDNLADYVNGLCVPGLTEIAETWGRAVTGVLQATISAGAAMAEANLPQVLSGVAEQCRTEHAAALDELAELGTRLQGVMQSLGELTEAGATEILTASEAEVREAQETESGLEELLSALLRVKEQLASYTFVQM
jgi:DNA repair exonuclease SbcCD ATPase subunit